MLMNIEEGGQDMLYPKNSSETLALSLFKNPDREYRGAPFWAWNSVLNLPLLEKQIDCFKEMGFGGFHIHSRTGMATPYLSDAFFQLVKGCTAKAEQENMLVWLYDEDRWPSGTAGGMVTKSPKHRARKLVFTVNSIDHCMSKNESVETGDVYLLACYDVILNNDGTLNCYKKIADSEAVQGVKWFAYVMTNKESPWFNNQTYVDTLSKTAIDAFIDITHERYKKHLGDKFGKTIPAIFTDEPQFQSKTTLNHGLDQTDVALPWSNDIPETYFQAYGTDILEDLPELVWDLPKNRISKSRYLYHEHIAERFAKAFADNCGRWCEENGIMLTGHVMGEESLLSQTRQLGEAMRSYRAFHLPGIDVLCDNIEFMTAKQAQSVSHQYGREGVLSELYGVTNWDFDFRGHKLQGDWQAALGVTLRVPHLSWVSMAGEAKRDYPASIGYQSPWCKAYSYVENHFARVNTALTRGNPVVSVGVIHPVESYWLHWGPRETTSLRRSKHEDALNAMINWLLLGQIDFDFIAESLLPELCTEASAPLVVGKMRYDTILVPGCETLRATTLDRLERFKAQGGRLIFMGDCPKYVDAMLSDRPRQLYGLCEKTSFLRADLLETLSSDRHLEIRNQDGILSKNLIYTMRQDNDCKWLFVAHGTKIVQDDMSSKPQKITIKVLGEYTPLRYDTLTGNIEQIDFLIDGGNTFVFYDLYCHDSLLLRLGTKDSTLYMTSEKQKRKLASTTFKERVAYKREEPNVLLLDSAEYAFDSGEFHPQEDILKVDNLFRSILGMPLRGSAVAQPWTMEQEMITHTITLKFVVHSEIMVESPILAIEDAADLCILFNGKTVPSIVRGYYVDESIKTIELPAIEPGENTLIVKLPFGKSKCVEYCYLLGEFDVTVNGSVKTIVKNQSTIGFGSITNQGLPFYGGNITYKTELDTPECSLVIKANHYKGALVEVYLDNQPYGVIAYAPYKIIVPRLSAGKHTVAFTLYGNRYNTFGALHNADASETWFGPNYWRSDGDNWQYEYKLKDIGILSSPVIEIYESEDTY